MSPTALLSVNAGLGCAERLVAQAEILFEGRTILGGSQLAIVAAVASGRATAMTFFVPFYILAVSNEIAC